MKHFKFMKGRVPKKRYLSTKSGRGGGFPAGGYFYFFLNNNNINKVDKPRGGGLAKWIKLLVTLRHFLRHFWPFRHILGSI